MAKPALSVPFLKSECHEETNFWPQRILYDESAGRQKLEEEIAQIQRKGRYAQRLAGMMAFLTAFAGAGLAYPAILLENFPRGVPQFIINFVCALGGGSLISFLALARLGRVYRKRLVQRKNACLQKFSKRFASSLGQPLPAPLPHALDNDVGHRNDGTAHVAAEATASP